MDVNGQWTFSFPTLIRFGAGVVEELGPCLKSRQKRSPLIVTDPVLRDLPLMKKILKNLEGQGLRVVLFSDIHKNPIKQDVLKGAEIFLQEKCDAVVGIGGGASLDVARAICLKAYHPGELFSYEDGKGDHLITGEIPYFITIPTTSGTGSEVGRSAIISDDQTHEKKILFSPRLLASQVFADPLLTMDLPAPVAAATGMDALTHNIEAFLGRGFHPMCEGLAQEGMRLVGENLEKSVKERDYAARAKMMMASMMGAVAFQKGLGVVHSCAHPLSTVFDTHHGLANAIMLSYGMEFNQSVCLEKFRRIGETLQTSNVVAYLRQLNEKVGLPLQLSKVGVQEKDLQALSHLAFLDFCHPSNPRPVTENDFLEIYRKAL